MRAKLISFLNAPIQPSLQKQGYSVHIEQYRGLCALLVLLNHAEVHPDLLLNNFKWPRPVEYISSGYLSVLMFFCISGYVIAVSNNNSWLDIKTYLKRRAIRLYPIYIIALIICLFVATSITAPIVIGNLLFLQNLNYYWHFSMPILVNGPTWSLNYEVLYYLLFVALFFVRPKVWQLLTGMLVLSFAMFNTGSSVAFFVNYLNGYYFWIMGLLIGWQVFKSTGKVSKISLLSILFLHLCHSYLGLGSIMMSIMGLNTSSIFTLLFYFSFCLMVMCTLLNKDSLFLRVNKMLCYALPGLLFIYLALHRRIFEDQRWVICLIFWALSLLFYNEKKISAFLLNKLTWVGQISYAIYVLHSPIAQLIKKTVFIDNQLTEVIVKYLLWLSITFSLAALLELKLQPAIKKYLLKS